MLQRLRAQSRSRQPGSALPTYSKLLMVMAWIPLITAVPPLLHMFAIELVEPLEVLGLLAPRILTALLLMIVISCKKKAGTFVLGFICVVETGMFFVEVFFADGMLDVWLISGWTLIQKLFIVSLGLWLINRAAPHPSPVKRPPGEQTSLEESRGDKSQLGNQSSTDMLQQSFGLKNIKETAPESRKPKRKRVMEIAEEIPIGSRNTLNITPEFKLGSQFNSPRPRVELQSAEQAFNYRVDYMASGYFSSIDPDLSPSKNLVSESPAQIKQPPMMQVRSPSQEDLSSARVGRRTRKSIVNIGADVKPLPSKQASEDTGYEGSPSITTGSKTKLQSPKIPTIEKIKTALPLQEPQQQPSSRSRSFMDSDHSSKDGNERHHLPANEQPYGSIEAEFIQAKIKGTGERRTSDGYSLRIENFMEDSNHGFNQG